MERTLQILNELEREGVLGRYAIGGAMGATFYVEPLLTFDLDVFVVLPQTGDGLLTLAPLYEALRQRGYAEEEDCVDIEGVPVQFLPAYNALLEEALAEAREILYEQTPTRVLSAEHLAALRADRTGERPPTGACLLGRGRVGRRAARRRSEAAQPEREMEPMDDLNPEIIRILRAQETRRHRLARQPFPEKVKAVVQMQRMAAPILRLRGRNVRVWRTTRPSS